MSVWYQTGGRMSDPSWADFPQMVTTWTLDPDPLPEDTTDEPEPPEPRDDDASDPSVADPTDPEPHKEGEPA